MAAAELKKPILAAVIEDEPALRKMIVSLLQADPDYRVVAEFAEGKPAIAEIPRLAPDIVLVDIGLPDMSGIEVIRKLKVLCPKCNLLVVTTFGDEKTVTSALEAGADGYLLKGTPLEELRRDIQSLQDGGSPLSPMIARKLLNSLQSKADGEKPGTGRETKLTGREHEILEMITKGFSYSETSKICGISAATVHSHLKSIYRKLEVHSKTEAVYEGAPPQPHSLDQDGTFNSIRTVVPCPGEEFDENRAAGRNALHPLPHIRQTASGACVRGIIAASVVFDGYRYR